LTRIKICGVTNIETADLCAELEVNFIGLVFENGRLRVKPDIARGITAHISKIPKRPVVVGVFSNTPYYEVNLLAEYCNLDWIQLPGDVPMQFAKALKRPVVRVTQVDRETTAADVQSYVSGAFGSRSVRLFETPFIKNGATDVVFDWQIFSGLSPFIPVLIGGGLTSETVGNLIETCHPWGVNVSAEVERAGKKSQSKIKTFIKAVKEADARPAVSIA
jgi:phosphoribosylanthranilate isomerase